MADLAEILPDIVHFHCEYHFKLVPSLRAKVKIIGSRWSRLYERENEAEARKFFAGESYVCCVSPRLVQRCLEMGLAKSRLFLAKNGARSDLINFNREPYFSKRAICLGAVNQRKRQYLLKEIACVDFAGPIRPEKNPEFERHPNYMGEWPKAKVYAELTDYANLVLLSQAEAGPLATCEALMAGLGLVVSEAAAANLDRTLPFIQVVPEDRLKDRDFLEQTIKMNQEIARSMRPQIRQYAVENFDTRILTERYLAIVESFMARSETKN